MYNKQDIQDRLNEVMLEEYIQTRFYHFRSIQNFILSFDKLDSKEKEKVYFNLMEYLDVVKKDPITNMHQCADLFTEYIRPVGSLYENSYGFMPNISWWIIIFWAIFSFGILYVFNLSIIFYIIIGVFFISYYIYILKKRIEKKVYGLGW